MRRPCGSLPVTDGLLGGDPAAYASSGASNVLSVGKGRFVGMLAGRVELRTKGRIWWGVGDGVDLGA